MGIWRSVHSRPVFRAGNTSPSLHSARVQMSELGPEPEDTLPHWVLSETIIILGKAG